MLRQMMISAALVAGLLMADLPVQASPSPLTNNDVVTLAQAGLGEETIVAAIQAQDASFDISVPALLKLKQDGVTPKVLRAMVAAMSKRDTGASVPASAWRTNDQAGAGVASDLTNQSQATSQAPAPASKKGSWLKVVAALGKAGRAVSSAGVDVADGTGHVGSSFKDSFMSGFSNAVNRQSNAYMDGTSAVSRQSDAYADGPSNQDEPTVPRGAFAAPQQSQATGYYMTPDGNLTPVENPAQASQGSRQYAGAATPASASGTRTAMPSRTQAVIMFTAWRDPREGAFTMNVPQGWQVTGGTIRNSAIDPRPVVRATSPDHRIQVFYGDANLIPREVPNRMTAFAGMREGQTVQGAWGGPILLARYQTGEQFARGYIAAQLCRAPQITSAGTLQDASSQLSAAALAYGRAQGASAQAWVGETNFQCGARTGYVRASTVLAGSATGQGVGIWIIMELGGFMAADPSQVAMARYILNNMAGSFKLDPQWEARQAQTTRDVTGAVTRAQQQMAASIAQHARQQAQSNQIDVMSGWEKRNKVMDGIMQRDSDTRLGITTATDDITGSHTVSNDFTYHWTRPDGSIVGTNTDTPPDYSSGWRMMH